MSFSVKKGFLFFSFLCIPFVLLWWMAPFIGNKSIGYDHITFTVESQLEMIASLRMGEVPLYIPGLAHGNTASALTLSQFWHPISHLSSIMPNYWNGYALEWNNFWRFISLGLCQVLLYTLFRRMKVQPFFAFILSLIAVYNQRMLDMLRYGAALENYTAFLFLVTSVYYSLLSEKVRLWRVCIIISSALLVTGGHPPMAYLAFIGAGTLTIVAPFIVRVVCVETGFNISVKGYMYFMCATLACALTGVLLASAYTFPFYFEFLSENSRRVHAGYNWASGYPETFYGLFSNFVNPLRSDCFSAFGGSVIIFPALLLPLMGILTERVNRVSLTLWFILVFALMVILGKMAPFHYFLWKVMPLYSSFRCPGRIGVFIPLTISFIIAILLKSPRHPIEIGNHCFKIHPLAFISLIALPIYFIWNVVPSYELLIFRDDGAGWGTALRMHREELTKGIRAFSILLGGFTLVLLTFWGVVEGQKKRSVVVLLLTITIVVQSALILRFGAPVVEKPKSFTWKEMSDFKQHHLDFPFSETEMIETTDVLDALEHAFLEPRLARISRNVFFVDAKTDAFTMLAKMDRKPETAILENVPEEKRALIRSNVSVSEKESLKLLHASNNRLVFEVSSAAPGGVFVLNYPFSNRWKAYIQNQNIPTYRVNGLEQGVIIPEKGVTELNFRYSSPSSTAGVAMSCLVAVLVAIYAFAGLSGHKVRVFLLLGVCLTSAGMFLFWRSHLYSNTSQGVKYLWVTQDSDSDSDSVNIAYGKPAQASQVALFQEVQFPPSEAVDASMVSENMYYSGIGENIWWQVDLRETRPIKQIKIYLGEGLQEYLHRSRNHHHLIYPDMEKLLNSILEIQISDNGEDFKIIGTVMPESSGEPYVVSFPETTARFVRVFVPGKGALALGEVQVFTSPEHVSYPLSGN